MKKEQIPLSKLTSLHVGGPARYLFECKTKEDVLEAIQFATSHSLPFITLGKGSNVIFSDDGYPGVVILMQNRSIEVSGTTVTAGAGAFMRLVTTKALEAGLRGTEELAGIPGTIGGAVRGNAGTWSTETKDILKSVLVLKPNGKGEYEETVMTPNECDFGYRHSIFKLNPDWIILSATLALTPGDKEEGEALVRKDYEQRHLKQPYDAPSAGSVFKNPDKQAGIYSGSLIEQCNLKGMTIGGAQVSEKHGNFIVNKGGATSQDVLRLIAHIQAVVLKEKGVQLEPEIQIIANI